MAYFVAKVLHLRPWVILTEWTCEELLVAYGVYANQQSKEAYDMKTPKERTRDKLEYMDRWALPFFTPQDIEQNVAEEEEGLDEEMAKIAETLFS